MVSPETENVTEIHEPGVPAFPLQLNTLPTHPGLKLLYCPTVARV